MMLDRKKVDQASKMASRFMLNVCQVGEEDHPDHGGFRTEFDLEDRKFRMVREPWHTAAAVRALLRIHGRTRNQSWLEGAGNGGMYLERLQCREEDCIMEGALWDPWIEGEEPLRVDSSYRSILGLLDLYGPTGSGHYLETARQVAKWFKEDVYRGGGTHLNRYFPDKETFGWPRSHILDEGSFARLQDLTREKVFGDIYDDQVDALVDSWVEPGVFSCRDAPRMEKDDASEGEEVSTRNMYWHLAPLITACEKRRKERFIQPVSTSLRLIMNSQSTEGYVPQSFDPTNSVTNGGPDGTGTAMFAILWLKMYGLAAEDVYMEASEKAISWIVKSQFLSRETFLGAFYEGKSMENGEIMDSWGAVSSIYGVLACEEYLKTSS